MLGLAEAVNRFRIAFAISALPFPPADIPSDHRATTRAFALRMRQLHVLQNARTMSPRVMTRLVAATMVGTCVVVATSCAHPTVSTTAMSSTPLPAAAIATPRTDANSMEAHRQLLAKRTQGRIDVYLFGNSITRRWGATDYPEFLTHFRQTFFGWNAADFGWGADRTEHMLWRLEHGELDGVNPKVIILLAGTNNVGNTPGGPSKVDDITRGLITIIETFRQKAPKATILVTGIFPRNDNPRDPRAVIGEITRINANLARYADGKRVRFLSVNNRLADSTGLLYPGMMGDNLHPTLKGYQVWADALVPLLQQLLGPRATVDRAPPPTGDPGIKG